MRFFSHYIWESGSEEKGNPVSILLQQVSVKGHHCLLACICDGRKSTCTGSLVSGYFTERLVEWFHQDCLVLIQKRRLEDTIRKSLEAEFEKINAQLQEYGRRKDLMIGYDVRGILLWDNLCWIFGQGDYRGYLFNRRFNKKQRRNLPGNGGTEMEILPGNVQKNIGILLCDQTFAQSITEEEMIQVLSEETVTDQKIQKSLRELWKEEIARGGSPCTGAIYIRLG